MKPLWKVQSFAQQTYRPQHTLRETRTDRRKVTVIHRTSKRTGTTRHDTRQHRRTNKTHNTRSRPFLLHPHLPLQYNTATKKRDHDTHLKKCLLSSRTWPLSTIRPQCSFRTGFKYGRNTTSIETIQNMSVFFFPDYVNVAWIVPLPEIQMQFSNE